MVFFFFFVKPKCKKENPTLQHRKVGKRQRTKKPLTLSSMNNGSQVHEISKWVLREQTGSKWSEKKEIVSSKLMGSM